MESQIVIQWLLLSYWVLRSVTATDTVLSQETFLDPDRNFFLRWGFNASHIDMQVTAQTLGWLAIAISPNGSMHTSDGMIAWVEDSTGEVTVQDRWLTAPQPYTPKRIVFKLDAQQDWSLISGSQNTTHTTVRVVRKLVTCDPEDRPITKDSVRLLYSLFPEDPIPSAIWFIHHTERGARSLTMLSDSFRTNSTSALTEKDCDLSVTNRGPKPPKPNGHAPAKSLSLTAPPMRTSKNVAGILHMKCSTILLIISLSLIIAVAYTPSLKFSG